MNSTNSKTWVPVFTNFIRKLRMLMYKISANFETDMTTIVVEVDQAVLYLECSLTLDRIFQGES